MSKTVASVIAKSIFGLGLTLHAGHSSDDNGEGYYGEGYAKSELQRKMMRPIDPVKFRKTIFENTIQEHESGKSMRYIQLENVMKAPINLDKIIKFQESIQFRFIETGDLLKTPIDPVGTKKALEINILYDYQTSLKMRLKELLNETEDESYQAKLIESLKMIRRNDTHGTQKVIEEVLNEAFGNR
jgi:hypothetical protein